MIRLVGFAPDLDPTAEGVIVDCHEFIPYEAGLAAAPSEVNVGLSALASPCRGAAVTRDLSSASRLFAGTAGDIFELNSPNWTSVASGFTLSDDDVWRFAVFGNSPLAVCPASPLLRSTGGAFSVVPGAPSARAIVVAKGFVMLLATNETGLYGDSPDRWWCSAYFDETNWTPNVATQCNTGRLVEGSGPLTAGLRMGDTVVAYKERCIFVGIYVGGDVVWQWSPPIGDVGCVGVEAVADTPVGHVFVGSDNFYVFDGTRPVPIGDPVKQWWLDNSSAQLRYRTKLLWDREKNCVYVFYPSAASAGECDEVLVYHVGTKQWGRMTRTVEAVINYASQGITYDSGSPLITDYDSGPMVSFDSPFWLASKSSAGFFNSAHAIHTLTGIPGECWFMTGDYGDENGFSYCSALQIRCETSPDVMSCQGYTLTTSGKQPVEASAADFDGAKFPLRQEGRFHRFKVTTEGVATVSAVRPMLKKAAGR